MKTTFTFLTWNLCLLDKSDQAPVDWRPDQTEDRIRQFILSLAPDFVLFQELPGLVPYVETHDMVRGDTISHSGHIVTLAKRELMPSLNCRVLDRAAVLTTIEGTNLTLANVHLPSGGNVAGKRRSILRTLVEHSPTPHLLIAGDTNMQISEAESLDAIGLAGSKPPRPTWDSRTNQFRAGGRAFTAYYSRYFHTAKLTLSDVQVWDEPVDVDGKRFFISDHFPLSATISL